MHRKIALSTFLLVCFHAFSSPAAGPPGAFTTVQELGGALYFDKNLSLNRNQSCASCHLPATGFDDPNQNLPVSEGSIRGVYGGRNAPSSAYAAFAPAFRQVVDSEAGTAWYEGGQFWDGRADSLADQAAGPPLNLKEMAMPSKDAVVARLAENPRYVRAFLSLYGIDLNAADVNVDGAYSAMAQSIGELERTRLFNQFNSRFDYFLAGKGKLSAGELRGWELFNGKAKCALCHVSTATPVQTADGEKLIPPLFTDFTYDNLGIPANPQIAALQGLASLDPDLGLGAPERLNDPAEEGKFKVMTLRNIALTAPYGHNGYFRTLQEIVHFYNTRDVLPDCASPIRPLPGRNCWPAPEVAQNMNTEELGNLGLNPAEESDLLAFLKTLTDTVGPSPFGPVPVPPMP